MKAAERSSLKDGAGVGGHSLFAARDTYRVAINKRTSSGESAIIRDPLALNT